MRTAEQIAVMQASLEGKRIEFKSLRAEVGAWVNCKEPAWQWLDFDYRVAEPAPEPRRPREFWVNEFRGDSYSFAFRSEATARGMAGTVALDTLRLTEIPPGWRLVPPVGERPLPEGVPMPPEDSEYFGFNLPCPPDSKSNDLYWWFEESREWVRGAHGTAELRHYAIVRNTALHAANFGEVAR